MKGFIVTIAVALWFSTGTAATLGPVRSMPSPAGAGSGQPRLTALADGGLLMSWLEGGGGKSHRLRLSVWRGSNWDAPRTVAKGEDVLVNGADFPGVHEIEGGVLVAHWLRKSGPEGYGVWVSTSKDRGRTWSASRRLHHDASTAEHGFVSVIPKGNGALAVWLDGHDVARAGGEGHGGEMALLAADISADGVVSRERLLDSRVCDCCQTAAVRTTKGALVAYRDRGPSEIRDISLLREKGKHGPLHVDGWKIDGCPVNGPALDARSDRVVAAWFTAPNEKPHLRATMSRDGGASFSAPIEIAGGEALGRTGVSLLAKGGAIVTWTEVAADRARLVARVIGLDGKTEAPVEVAKAATPRWSGVPQVAAIGDRAYFAWTISDKQGTSVRLASAPLR